ncbi:radical SAM protein [Bacillus sp. SM2101]|uniref:radical SAM protein n=1 Tax=Bacillus sp. SM2101 TaxID=2805366 RepID=UPI001BDEFDB8|nr:radical SAM protein [Bacillus sp. SM2101]
MLYRQSKFSHVFEKDNNNNYILFNSNSLGLFELSKEDYQIYKQYEVPKENYQSEVAVSLKDNKFIVPLNETEFKDAKQQREIRRRIAKRTRKNRIGYLRISLTEKCNLRCKYCFVNDIYTSKGNMETDLFVNTMNWFIEQNIGASPIIQYFGGEPLIRMDLIKKGHEMLQEAKNSGKITGFTEEIVSNGTLVTEEIAQYFKDTGILLVFSIDGWKEINDKNRIYPNGNGSYSSVLQGMENYKNVGGNLSGIITPTNENLPIFKNIIKHLVEDLGCTEISINTPQPNERGWDIDGKKLAKAIMEAWEYCDSKKIPINQPGNNIVFSVNNKIPQTNSCMNLTYGQQENSWGVYLTSQGLVSNCVVECDERCTQPFDEFELNEEYINWHFEDHSKDSCLKCVGYNICGGPCTFESIVRNKKLNPEKCKFYKTIIPWALTRD